MKLVSDPDLTLLVGDVRDVLATLPDGSVDCCVTSPPYWGLRDYGTDGQLGLEATPDEYVANMSKDGRARLLEMLMADPYCSAKYAREAHGVDQPERTDSEKAQTDGQPVKPTPNGRTHENGRRGANAEGARYRSGTGHPRRRGCSRGAFSSVSGLR